MEPFEIALQPYTYNLVDDGDGSGQLHIHIWGLTRESKPVLVKVCDYIATMYVELPSIIEGKKVTWDSANFEKFVNYLNFVLGDHRPIIVRKKKMKKLFYYQSSPNYQMAFLAFRNEEAMRHCNNVIRSNKNAGIVNIRGLGQCTFKTWEADIPTIRKFFTAIECGHTQWMSVKGKLIEEDNPERISKSGNSDFPVTEVTVKTVDITPLSEKETKKWYTSPRVLSYDIETYCDNHKTFPSAYNDKHCIFNISFIYKQRGLKDTTKRYCIVYGESDEVEGTEIIRVNTELELIEETCNLINRLDPDILIGYNIFGFDNSYLNVRLSSEMRDWPNVGRLKVDTSEFKHIKWSSSGYGHNEINYLDMNGRITIDLLPIARRSLKLDKYSLDFVSNYLLGRGKHPVKPKDMFVAFENNQAAIKSGDPLLLAEARKEMGKVVAYCVEDSELVIDIFEKIHVWFDLLEMSNVVRVSIMEIFTRGQIIRVESLIYNKAYKRGIVFDKRDITNATYVGAFVFPPKPGKYDKVICLDFSSLYPSIIMAMNISPDTLFRPDQMGEVEMSKVNRIEFDQAIEKLKKNEEEDKNEFFEDDSEEDEPSVEEVKHFCYDYIKKDEWEGILPQIERELVSERSAVRKEAARVEQELEDGEGTLSEKEVEEMETVVTIMDKRQLALKVTANSIYGYLGNVLKEAASSVTGYGRQSIHLVETYLKEKYNATIVYGDTDSIMIQIEGITAENINKFGRELAKEVSSLFPPPLKMEYEKGMRMIVFKKKKYATRLYNDDGSFKKNKDGSIYIMSKGVTTARRDNCKWIRETYTDLLDKSLGDMSISDSIEVIYRTISSILKNQVPVKKLAISKALGANYKSNSTTMKVFGDELMRLGKPIQPGERLDYVVVLDKEGRDLLGLKQRLVEDYTDSEEKELIDCEYYIHLLMNPIDQLFSTSYMRELEGVNVGYEPEYRRLAAVSIQTPVKMFLQILRDLRDFTIEEKITMIDDVYEQLSKVF